MAEKINFAKQEQRIKSLESELETVEQIKTERDRNDQELKKMREKKEELEAKLSAMEESNDLKAIELKGRERSARDVEEELKTAKERIDKLSKELSDANQTGVREIIKLKQAAADAKTTHEAELV